MTDEKASYGQILKSSSIMGAAAAINMLLSMVRTKFAAVLIGPTGVGLIASFGAVQGLIGTVAGLGIQSSAVRDIAAAVGRNDEQVIGRVVLTVRRVSWVTGLVGMLAMVALSPLISQFTFSSDKYSLDIAALGIIILFGNIAGGQLAVIQGMRRIGDMARANILGNMLGTVTTISIYYWLGLRGIIPALVVLAALQLAIACLYARRVPVPYVRLSWRATFKEANDMVKLGLVFMWNSLLGSIVTFAIIALITREFGLQAVGLYSAAYALSGVFVNFVNHAMGTDYYPRLISVGNNKTIVNRMVNEQTEVNLLLSIPGLLAMMTLAPWLIQIFYTKEFYPAAELLQWFCLGCLGRMIAWPLGFLMLAMNKKRHFLAVETLEKIVHVLLVALGIGIFGIKGVAIAFTLLLAGYTVAVYFIGRQISDFAWSTQVIRLVGFGIFSQCLVLILVNLMTGNVGLLGGVCITVVAIIISLKGLNKIAPVKWYGIFARIVAVFKMGGR